MDRIIIENIRCFNKRQTIPLKPITFLVGENSTGKSTFLALNRIMWDLCTKTYDIDFNEEPFLLGTYDQIASFRGGRAGRAQGFQLGAEFNLPKNENSPELPEEVKIQVKFTHKGSQPIIESWSLQAGNYKIEMQFEINNEKPTLTVRTPSGSASTNELPYYSKQIPLIEIISVSTYLLNREIQKLGNKQKKIGINNEELEILGRITGAFASHIGERPYAFAPIRTRPKRTYDPLKDTPEPQGSHIPLILAKTIISDPQSWESLHKAINNFGLASGLFSDLVVKRLGHKDSDPFQIQVKIHSPAFNLVDVGYGVSQILPIIVDILRSPKLEAASTYLLQQPEVHLHPVAQAELGSFLATIAKTQNKRFIIETHSDFLVDRVRMDIREGNLLSPDDVSILYFSRKKTGVGITEIRIDKYGNIINPPRGYRKFFLREEQRLIGGS